MIPVAENIRKRLLDTGAIAVAWGEAGEIDEKAWRQFREWLASGHNADMGYMANHEKIRRDPRLLLEGAKTIITLAYPFKPERYRAQEKGMIACYAYGDDYHEVLRAELELAVKQLSDEYGGCYRICIDSAPIMERYWAVRTGLGTLGENGSVIVEGGGNMVFLAEIVTTLTLPDFRTNNLNNPKFDKGQCDHCGACRRVCPAGAILEDGTVDARRCLSYLTIEHRGEWTSPEALDAMNTPAGRNTIFGCDLCLRACHLNCDTPSTTIQGFQIRSEIFSLSKSDIAEMTQEGFSRRFHNSPIKRAKLAGLKRNVGKL